MKGTWSIAILILVVTSAGPVLVAEAQDSGAGQPRKGTVTYVGSGPGLLGGPITTSGTLSVDFSMVAASNHTHPDSSSPWLVLSEDSISYPGHFVGIGTQNPLAALEVDSTSAQLVLHDRTGGSAATIRLEDSDNTGETLNLSFAPLVDTSRGGA